MSSFYNVSHEYCDADALLAEKTNVSALQPDRFYKICPGQYTHLNGTNAALGQPRCGDGTNFSFLVSRPLESKLYGRDKIIIEFSGGGACWDEFTCSMQEPFLTFPQEWLGPVVGTSCTNWSLYGNTMLCGKTIGETDFSEYTSVLVPYCTQDVHMGDDQSTEYGVRHVGGHNLYRTLQWVFDNFPDPSHIFITGCSAGATPFPVVYDMINTHYTENGKEVEINGIADSPVFITPSYFLENGIEHWNLGTVMNMVGFDFEKYKEDEDFPNHVLDSVLQKSKKTDQWGYATHDADVVSLLYYSFMTGSSVFGSDLGQRSRLGGLEPPRRRMDDDLQAQWWMKMNNSMSLAMNDHDNFHSFVMEGTEHCTFSLVSKDFGMLVLLHSENLHLKPFYAKNVPIQYQGFEEWASMIVQDSDEGDGVSTTMANNSSLFDNELLHSTLTAKNDTVDFSVNSTVGPGAQESPNMLPNLATPRHDSCGAVLLASLLLTWRILSR
jgi:hypothetical protein